MRLLRTVARGVVTAAVLGYRVLDALFTPVLRPVWRFLGKLDVFQAIGRWIGRQPPYVVLLLLAVPFLVIEPAKLFAVYVGVTGHPVEGTLLLVAAHAMSLLICERIYHAGHGPLMRIGWFARLMAWLFGLRDAALRWIRATAAWRRAGIIWRWLRRMLRA